MTLTATLATSALVVIFAYAGVRFFLRRMRRQALANRRKLIEQCVPQSQEEADFFARCYEATRDKWPEEVRAGEGARQSEGPLPDL